MRYLLLILLSGCAALPSGPITIPLEKVIVHVVPDESYFPENMQGIRAKGCADSSGRIWVIGEKWQEDGKIHINFETLGHELNHLLNWKNPLIHKTE